jgi:hypothetical protein
MRLEKISYYNLCHLSLREAFDHKSCLKSFDIFFGVTLNFVDPFMTYCFGSSSMASLHLDE